MRQIIYASLGFLFFVLCILIVLLFSANQFIRGFLGDAVIVMLIYCFIKIFRDINSFRLSIGVTILAYVIEFSQYIKIITLLGFKENLFTRIVFGSVFDPLDLVAYTIGGLGIYLLDVFVIQKFLPQQKLI